MLHIRCSFLPQLSKCSAPPFIDGPTIDGVNVAAEIGTAVHEQLARSIGGYPVPEEPFSTYSLDDKQQDEAMVLFLTARKIWTHHLAGLFPIGVEIEREYRWPDDANGLTLTGHVDVGGWMDTITRHYGVVDLKTGRNEDEDQIEQLVGYAFLAAKEQGARVVTAIVFYARSGNWIKRSFTIEQLEDWYQRFPVSIAKGSLKYSPGGHCVWCPKYHSCPAQQAMTRNVMQTFLADENCEALAKKLDEWGADAAKPVSMLLEDLPLLSKAEESARAVLRNLIKTKGDLPMPDGRVLTLAEQVRLEIDARAAWPVLRARLTEDDMARVLRVSKGELENRVKYKAEKGGKKAAVDQIMQELKDAGAISERTVDVMTQRKRREGDPPTPIQEGDDE